MSMPKRLIIEYEDGSTKGIDFDQLSRRSCLELSKLGGFSPLSARQPSKSYLLLRWKDGWQEVLGVDKTSIELLRYYILERVEEVGRIALEVEGDYPVLLVIKRRPKQLDSLLIMENGNQKLYGFEPRGRREEGGRIEHVAYDKAEGHSQHESGTKAETQVEEIMDLLQTELGKRGLTAEKLLALEQAQSVREYEELARVLGIRAAEEQDDVYGFMRAMLQNLAGK